MANRLKMAEIDTILTLCASGHSNRAIADLLGLDRGTVGKYVARSRSQNPPNCAPRLRSDSVPQLGPVCTSGPPSSCEPYREQILAKLKQGLHAVRIQLDLRRAWRPCPELLQRAAIHRSVE